MAKAPVVKPVVKPVVEEARENGLVRRCGLEGD